MASFGQTVFKYAWTMACIIPFEVVQPVYSYDTFCQAIGDV